MIDLTQEPGFAEFLQQRRKEAPRLIVRAAEVQELALPERGQREWYPATALDARTIGFHVAELEPGHRSGTHRHTCEALIYIISGEGTTYYDGEPVEWSTGDTIYVPPLVWHSHENRGDAPARVLGMWNIPLLERLGLFYNEELGGATNGPAVREARDTALPVGV